MPAYYTQGSDENKDTDTRPSLPEDNGGYFDGFRADRLLAVLSLLRQQEITPDEAATLVGLPKDRLIYLMRKLQIPYEQ